MRADKLGIDGKDCSEMENGMNEEKGYEKIKIIEYAEKCFEESGIYNVTLEEIAKGTDISVERILELFEDKRGLVREVYMHMQSGAVGMLCERADTFEYKEMSGLRQIEEIIRHQYMHAFMNWKRVVLLNEIKIVESKVPEGRKYRVPDDYAESIYEIIRAAIEKGVSDGSMDENIDIPKMAHRVDADMRVHFYGIMNANIPEGEERAFVPKEQMEFYIELFRCKLKNRAKVQNDKKYVEQYDSLTGLLSKENFNERVKMIIDENPDKKYEIIVTDIEKFKLINDNYGIYEGDKLLKYIGERIKRLTSDGELVSSRTMADKFFTLIEHGDGRVNNIVDEAINDISKYAEKNNIIISMKFGVYKIHDNNVPVESMCDRAALAANSIKGNYNVSCAYYDDSIRKKLLMEQTITNEMEKALLEGQFEVYYQPKYDLLTETMAGAEALVRWNHPERGFISPADFVPVFEKNGFITRMDMYVWEKTCEYIAKWKKEYGMTIPISVNVSRKDIYVVNLTEKLLELVEKYGIDQKDLHIEITETAYTEDSEQLIEVINELKEHGFIIEMDDFGSGYSSLNMLSEIPIDILKLDMRFVQGRDLGNNRNIMNFVMGLAKWMNLLVVAEGVETQEQINVLKALECNYVQGYFYSKPLPAKEFSIQLKAAEQAAGAELMKYTGEDGELYVQKGGSDRVLLVIDSVLWNCNLITEYFKDSYTVACTGNGEIAYNYIMDNAEKIDMIIVDLSIPGMSGMELIIKLRTDKHFAAIPIIATSQFGQGGEEMALTLGASDFVQKPYGRGVMIRRVQNLLASNSRKRMDNREDVDKVLIDPATGFYNQEGMKSQIYAFTRMNGDKDAVFIVIDIDDFKNIAETYGYSSGGMVIRNVVSVLKSSFRKDEIISHPGGDEFCIFLPEPFTYEGLKKRMDKLVDDLKFEVDDMKVTCSVGVCKYPENAADYEMLYTNAKSALEDAKSLGKNQYIIYHEES